MSIIADTLKRLQAHSTTTTPDVAEEPSFRPVVNQGEGTGRHLKASRMKFWIIGVGMTVGLAGLALSAFWIGWQIDFGLSTNTHARMDDSRPLLSTSLSSEIEVTIQEASGALVSAAPEISHPPPTSQAKEDNASQTSIASTDSSSTQVISPTHAPGHSRLVSGKSNSKGPPALEKLSHHPTSEVKPKHIGSIDSKKSEEPEVIPSKTATVEKKSSHTKQLIKTAKLSTNSEQRPSKHTAKKNPRRAKNTAVQTSIPLQPSPEQRLRQSQKLIQSGHYEEAVALLSPLFHEPPVKWQPWFWMGTALLGQEDLEQADQFFLSGLARNDKIPQLWIQRALVAQQRGNYQLAIHELHQAESLKADLPHIHLNMGYAYEQLGNDRMAKQYYGKFLKLSEGNPTFFSTRKKLFARVAPQIETERPLPPSVSSSLNP